MKKRIILAILLTVAFVAAGCTQKKSMSESIKTESTAAPSKMETKEEQSETPTIESFPYATSSPASEPPKTNRADGCDIIVATDIHYLSKDLTDFQKGFQYSIDHGDGKVMQYIWEIVDAFVGEVKTKRPDLVILSGDLTYNGEKESHLFFADKLKEIEMAGIPVIVILGNHDINNFKAAQFVGDTALATDTITPEEFKEIYQDFGYKEAISHDSASLSYVYQINEDTRVLMLDTCQYEPKNLVGGMIREDTYDWIEEQMEDAWHLGMNVIPVGHHNLLDESEVYLKDCTIEHDEPLIEQLESWEVPLFLSGHLHVQHYMRSDEDTGIYEIVTSSLSTPPCQYGLLQYNIDGSFRYHTKSIDMKAWANKTGNNDKNLHSFDEYGKRFLNKVFYNQAQDEFKRRDIFDDLTKDEKDQLASFYAEVNTFSYAGKVIQIREKASTKNGYNMWEEKGFSSILCQYLEWIISDGTKDFNILNVE